MVKHIPIKFEIVEKSVKDYHMVSRNELRNIQNTDTFQKCVDELNARVTFARKHFRGTYDKRHVDWMTTLAKPLKVHHKVSLSLDALVVLRRGCKH